MIRITIACPLAHMDDAGQFARATGLSAEDEATFTAAPEYQDADGNRYRVASGLVSETYPETATSPLSRPEWGANMDAAGRAQALIMIGGAADPEHIVAVVNDDPQSAIAELGLEVAE